MQFRFRPIALNEREDEIYDSSLPAALGLGMPSAASDSLSPGLLSEDEEGLSELANLGDSDTSPEPESPAVQPPALVASPVQAASEEHKSSDKKRKRDSSDEEALTEKLSKARDEIRTASLKTAIEDVIKNCFDDQNAIPVRINDLLAKLAEARANSQNIIGYRVALKTTFLTYCALQIPEKKPKLEEDSSSNSPNPVLPNEDKSASKTERLIKARDAVYASSLVTEIAQIIRNYFEDQKEIPEPITNLLTALVKARGRKHGEFRIALQNTFLTYCQKALLEEGSKSEKSSSASVAVALAAKPKPVPKPKQVAAVERKAQPKSAKLSRVSRFGKASAGAGSHGAAPAAPAVAAPAKSVRPFAS